MITIIWTLNLALEICVFSKYDTNCLYSYIKLLKSVEVLKFDENGYSSNKSCSFLDIIVLVNDIRLNISQVNNSQLKIDWKCYSDSADKDQTFKYIKRVSKMKFEADDKDVLTKLNLLKQVNIDEVGELIFDTFDDKDFEKFTNPHYFNYIIYFLSFYDYNKSWDSISIATLDNISRMNLRMLQQVIKKNEM